MLSTTYNTLPRWPPFNLDTRPGFQVEVTALDSANHRARNRSTGIERGSLIVARRFEATYFTRASPSLAKLSERFYGNNNNFVSLFESSNSRIVELHSIKEKRRELEFGNTTARKEGKKRK